MFVLKPTCPGRALIRTWGPFTPKRILPSSCIESENSVTIWVFAVAINVALVGVALIYWSKVLSENYNAWTTRLRSRSEFLRDPPKPETARLNQRIMVTLFRVFGTVLIAIAAWEVLALFR